MGNSKYVPLLTVPTTNQKMKYPIYFDEAGKYVLEINFAEKIMKNQMTLTINTDSSLTFADSTAYIKKTLNIPESQSASFKNLIFENTGSQNIKVMNVNLIKGE